MENKFNKLSIFDKENKKFWIFSKINFIFGYAQSGKTSVLSKISDIFSGKDKHYLLNGAQIMPNDFNIININSMDALSNHLKLNSKSLIKKMIELNKFSKDFESASNNIQCGLENAKNELQLFLSSILPGSKIKIANENNIMNLLLDNINIEMDANSDSSSKWNLFSVVEGLSSQVSNQTIVLMDDFNKEFDEEMTIAFFEKVRASNAIFFFTSRKPFQQYVINDEDAIFSVRDQELIQLPAVEKIAKDQIIRDDIYHSFEEYMLDAGYMEQAAVPQAFADKIYYDEKLNLLRILTSKNPVISYKNVPGRVTIIPANAQEENFYKKVFEILGLDKK